jgi:hypothetical protein
MHIVLLAAQRSIGNEIVNDRLISQRGFFFGMVLILAVLALILV